MLRFVALAATALALLPAVAGASRPLERAAAKARACGSIAFTPNTEDGVFDIRARRVGCRRARRVARGAKNTGATQGPFHYRRAGFRCHGRPEDVGLPSAKWKCRRAAARVTFTRG